MTEGKRHRPIWAGPLEAVITKKPVSQLLSKTMHRIDKPLLRLSRGRLSMAYGYPVLMLTTTGARSGKPRTVPLLYVDRGGDEVAIIGTRFGNTKHPAWYHNLRAKPEATVEINGRRWTASSRDADDDERAAIWAEAARNYSGYDKYEAWTEGRRVPVLVLSPRPPGDA